MAKCPECKKEVVKPSKEWKYGQFRAELFECGCGTKFREYSRNGKLVFTLKFKKGKDKGFVKA
ncbi:hypothetical protein MUP77_02475 [Candidatus Bathyarchaeota archaeon]|nr:hypothetical protein [Candidatus Bathyarchaeota archaeon]